jgi:HD superfamily phosphohydrolase
MEIDPSQYKTKDISKKKIFNDPIYGLVNFPHDILYQLIDHPYVQRLRRIKQLGLTDYVYSGGSHSRFNHCLGALHLMTQAIQILRWKGVEISDEESEAVSIAILLHDIGHGPFSHALEKQILPFHHEEISIRVMEILNEEYDGKLDLAIQIFKRTYPKPFLHQLVAGQIDMDRMDYLNRDSFYSGVVEGMIGYDRIIKMMNVKNGQLVIEEKAALSIEQFLMARRMMYWQVYLHKTVLAAEKMLHQLIVMIHQKGGQHYRELMGERLYYFFAHFEDWKKEGNLPAIAVKNFMELDDSDLNVLLKSIAKQGKNEFQLLAKGILERNIFKVLIKNESFSRGFIESIRQKIIKQSDIPVEQLDYLIIEGVESNAAYNRNLDEIHLLMKDGKIKPFAQMQDILLSTKTTEKHYLIFPRIVGMEV